jgi:CheY-like chemotaxis protein
MKVGKVLLVDDEPDIRRVGQMSLELLGGIEVVLASSGEDAIGLASQHRPDVILLDVLMPDLDGPATLVRLKEHESTRAIPNCAPELS